MILAACVMPVAHYAVLGHACRVWSPTYGPATWGVVLFVVFHVIIALCYFTVPIFAVLSVRRDEYEVPQWIKMPTFALAIFLFACGSEHLLRAIMRPIVYCGEDLISLGLVVLFSIPATWIIGHTCQAAILSLSFFSSHPDLAPALGAATPWDASRILRETSRRDEP